MAKRKLKDTNITDDGQPDTKLRKTVCDYADCDSLKWKDKSGTICNRCQEINYCSQMCREEDWKKHKNKCNYKDKEKYSEICNKVFYVIDTLMEKSEIEGGRRRGGLRLMSESDYKWCLNKCLKSDVKRSSIYLDLYQSISNVTQLTDDIIRDIISYLINDKVFHLFNSYIIQSPFQVNRLSRFVKDKSLFDINYMIMYLISRDAIYNDLKFGQLPENDKYISNQKTLQTFRRQWAINDDDIMEKMENELSKLMELNSSKFNIYSIWTPAITEYGNEELLSLMINETRDNDDNLDKYSWISNVHHRFIICEFDNDMIVCDARCIWT